MLVGKGIVHPKAYLVIVVAGSSDIIHIHRMHRTVGERVKRFLVCLPPFAAVRVRVEKISRKICVRSIEGSHALPEIRSVIGCRQYIVLPEEKVLFPCPKSVSN